MNKLFIIGNGFDLAHGYPTSYTHFVRWIWNNIHRDPSNVKFRRLLSINPELNFLRQYEDKVSQINCYKDFLEDFNKYKNTKHNIQYNKITARYIAKEIFVFENRFFLRLCTDYPDANWSDIESLFYKILIEVLENDNKEGININSLNSDMEQIKELFSEYLSDNVSYDNLKTDSNFIGLLEYFPIFISQRPNSPDVLKYLNEFPINEYNNLKTFDDKLCTADIKGQWGGGDNPPNTLILDFNYTDTIKNYLNLFNKNHYIFGNIQHIKIHGHLKNLNNPINLGFGDEMDDYYKIIEKKNDNRFLKYIKSFMYSNNSNYRNLLNWIDTNDFQVYILGHSCGLSDRIMLNTIFEKDRCKSIKVFYYEWEENGVRYNDFTDKIQNISRHFNKKALMREKLVDKSLSKSLTI